jgi:hypothetical protein
LPVMVSDRMRRRLKLGVCAPAERNCLRSPLRLGHH